MIAPDFLAALYREERWLTLAADGEVDLPSYAGSTLRKASPPPAGVVRIEDNLR